LVGRLGRRRNFADDLDPRLADVGFPRVALVRHPPGEDPADLPGAAVGGVQVHGGGAAAPLGLHALVERPQILVGPELLAVHPLADQALPGGVDEADPDEERPLNVSHRAYPRTAFRPPATRTCPAA